MKNKRIVAAVSALAVTMSCVPIRGFGLRVYADSEWSKFADGITTFGTSVISAPKAPAQNSDAWTGSYVYYGQYANQPVKYRVLNPNETQFGGTTMLLDCDTTLFTDAFRDDGKAANANVWAASDLYKVLNTNDDAFLNTSFTGAEAAAIAQSAREAHPLVEGSEAGNVASWTKEVFVDYTPLTGEKIFLLDAEDASNTAYGYSVTDNSTGNRKKKNFIVPESNDYGWWLRSPDRSDSSCAGFVYNDYGDFHIKDVDRVAIGVSPAFNINLSSVIFSSVIDPESTESYGKEFKLTLKDSNTTITPGTLAQSGDTVTVPYTVTDSDAEDGITADTVSVLITDDDGAVKYYAPLTGDFAMTGGSGTFDLPADYADTDTIYILAEDTHEGDAEKYLTDYASEPVEVAIPALHQITVADSIVNGSVAADKVTAAAGETVSLTVTPAEGYAVKSVKYNDTEITPVNDAYSFEMPAEDVTVTATFGYSDGLGAKLAGYSLSLDGDIGVNFYMELDDAVVADENAYMQFTLPNGDTPRVPVSKAARETVGGKTYYVFKCNVAAKEMTDTIKAQMFSGEKQGEEYSYTVKEYADYLLTNTEENEEYEKAAPLVKAMLDYGAYSQIYFKHNTDALANGGKDSTNIQNVDADTINKPYNPKGTYLKSAGDTTFEGATLSLKSETTLSLYFKSSTDLSFECNSYEVEKNTTADGYQIARIRGIKAADLDKTFGLNIDDAAETGITRTFFGYVNYCPLTYCYNVLKGGSDDRNLQNVCKALYLYWQAANEYSE